MKNNMDLNIKGNNDYLPLDENSDNKRRDIEDDNNSRYSLNSKSEENSILNIEEKDDNIKVTETISYKEKELSSLLEGYETSFGKKL